MREFTMRIEQAAYLPNRLWFQLLCHGLVTKIVGGAYEK